MDQHHWDSVYTQKGQEDLSWFQPQPTTSLALIQEFAPSKTARIIDVGGGTSTLPSFLLQAGFSNLTVLDISPVALERARAAFGDAARQITWIQASVTRFEPPQPYDLWHDRAVFHFLTRSDDRAAYLRILTKALPQGHAIISTFSLAGPGHCSGLPVERYDTQRIINEFGRHFTLIKSFEEAHLTPWGTAQHFANFVLKRKTGE